MSPSEDVQPEVLQCQAVTKTGQPCKNRAVSGSLYCRVHQNHEMLEVEGSVSPTRATEPGTPGGFDPDVEIPFAEDANPSDETLPSREDLLRLRAELNQLAAALRQAQPEYKPPPFSPQSVIDLIRSNLEKMAPEQARTLLTMLRESLTGGDFFDVETWKGIWYLLNYTVKMQTEGITRRMRGDYEVDPYGMDLEFKKTIEPILDFLYRTYWRVETQGLEHIPDAGRALLVANHSGVLPFDGSMVAYAIEKEHRAGRSARGLVLNWFPSLPFVSILLNRMGHVQANPENAERLLNEDQLVLVFPEGVKGVGKLYKDRYQLARFGRGGFVKIALRTGAPIIPVAVTGSEEIYPMLADAKPVAKAIGFPYFPITPFFPWFGALGVVPLPTKWYIDFGEPISTLEYGPETAGNPVIVARVTEQVRGRVQEMLSARLRKRRSIFTG